MERERMRRQVAWEAQALMPGSNILMAYQDATDIRQYGIISRMIYCEMGCPCWIESHIFTKEMWHFLVSGVFCFEKNDDIHIRL